MYVETSAMTGSGVTDLFKSIGVCIGWRLGVALKVRESMETNTKTGFQLLEVKNETPDKVLEVRWRVTGRVLDGGKKSGGCCKWLVCCKRSWESGVPVIGEGNPCATNHDGKRTPFPVFLIRSGIENYLMPEP